MIFNKTPVDGVYTIEIEKATDERGFFARSWCKDEFEKYGLDTSIVQCNISFNHIRGTIRALHYQAAPFEEIKIVRCTQGKIFDVVLDIRKDSSTYKKYFSIELSSENRLMLYIPGGIAHGFQTLEDNTEVFYQMSSFFKPESAKTIRWNDPELNIPWPLEVTNISDKDKNAELFSTSI